MLTEINEHTHSAHRAFPALSAPQIHTRGSCFDSDQRHRLFVPLVDRACCLSPSGKRTEEAPEARRSAKALDAGQAHRSVCKYRLFQHFP